jgi:uncharacterized membrane protein YdjX (TVP38/TMEM64 family)
MPQRRYYWVVFVGWFVVAFVGSAMTQHVLDAYGTTGSYRVLVTAIVAFALAGIFFYVARRLQSQRQPPE